ncbi:hypothetical protein U9M48_005552 [Paspalum notatum var. saurae]|uniref:Uncharacterized protein n=1 Tax=Paspalum notatum var. saurae TaxID=547442 RepID=A0AAQ3PMN2_PASNO
MMARVYFISSLALSCFMTWHVSVDMLMGNGTLTPHLPGMPATSPMLTLLTVPARFLRQRHACWRSALVLAALLRLFTPVQHDEGSALDLPVPYGMHGASADPTCPHEMAADAGDGAATTSSTSAATAIVILLLLFRAAMDRSFAYCRNKPKRALVTVCE